MNNIFLRKKLEMLKASIGGSPYYCELEYLESTGTQYIDTRILPSANLLTDIDFSITSNFTFATSSVLLGSYTRVASNYTLYSVAVPSSTELRFPTGNQFTNLTIPTIGTSRHNLKYAQGNQEFDGTQIGTLIGQQIVTTGVPTIRLFGRSSNDGTDYITGGIRIYRCRIYDDSTLIRDFIPVLDWNYVPCLYDKVSGQLFYNQGTGDFIAGREIHKVEYLESTGTQYINTGFIPTQTTATSISFNLINKLSTNYPAPIYCGNVYNSSNTYGFSFNVNSRCLNAYRGSKVNVHVGSQLNLNTFYNVVLNSTSITIKDVSGSILDSVSMEGTYQAGARSLYLFTGNTTTTDLTGIADMKLYGCKIWDNNILVRDYIPAVDENGIAFMFDRVGHKIYDNAGTGSFNYPDVELEYIQSSGTQYIDSGYTQTPNTELSVDCAFTDLSAGRFGSVKLVGSDTYRFYFGVLDNKWIGAVNSISPNHNIAAADYNRHQFDLNVTGLYIDGELKVAPSNNYPLTTITLFNLNTISISAIASAKLYSCTIRESGVLVKNYIPVIHNGTACLKNTLSNTYLTNAGTGTFIVGKIVEKRY